MTIFYLAPLLWERGWGEGNKKGYPVRVAFFIYNQ
jgi:hypothetical protein